MKAKTIIITTVVSASLLGGGIYGALRLVDKDSRTPVSVAPVSVLSVDTSWMEEDSTITGSIISKNIQNVELNPDFTLSKVHVKEGDTVKRGDPLLEYDMTIEQLSKEVREIQIQKKEKDLKKKQGDLEKLLKTPGAAAIYQKLQDAATQSETEIRTQSADIIEEGDLSGMNDELISGEDVIDPGQTPAGTDPQNYEQQSDNPGTDVIDDSGDDPFIVDDGESDSSIVDDMGDDTDFIDDSIQDDDDGQESIITDEGEAGQIGEDDDFIQARILEFLMLEELVRTYQFTEYSKTQDFSVLSEEDISRALTLYESQLSEPPGEEEETVSTFTDAFGNQREENLYYLSTEVRKALKEMERKYEGTDTPFSAADTAASLYRAYVNVAYYNLIYRNGVLEQSLAAAGTTPLTCSAEIADVNRHLIVAAVDAYYNFSANWRRIRQILQKKYDYTEEELTAMDEEFSGRLSAIAGANLALGDTSDGSLSYLIGLLNMQDVIQETETETPQTDPPEEDYGDDYGDDYDDYGDDYDDDEAMTVEELEDAITDAWMEIKEAELDIRESQSKMREDDNKLAQRVVYSQMDGVVKTAGTVEDSASSDEYFIVITGEAGMYAKGTVSEMELDTIKVGDVITGTSSETGEDFTATITEVSRYPEESQDDFYYYGYGMDSNNPNASNYPFLAYIEDASGLEEGYADLKLASEKKGPGGLYLDKFLIREDDAGRDYVMIRGEDGLLKKQVIQTGKILWGEYVQVKSGLSKSDMIAFPYGKNVVEGAKTEEKDNLDFLYGGMG